MGVVNGYRSRGSACDRGCDVVACEVSVRARESDCAVGIGVCYCDRCDVAVRIGRTVGDCPGHCSTARSEGTGRCVDCLGRIEGHGDYIGVIAIAGPTDCEHGCG